MDQVLEEADDQMVFDCEGRSQIGGGDPTASFKQSTGTEFFNKRMRKDGSGSRLQQHSNSKNPAREGGPAALPPDKNRMRFGGSQQNWMASKTEDLREGAPLSREQLRSRQKQPHASKAQLATSMEPSKKYTIYVNRHQIGSTHNSPPQSSGGTAQAPNFQQGEKRSQFLQQVSGAQEGAAQKDLFKSQAQGQGGKRPVQQIDRSNIYFD